MNDCIVATVIFPENESYFVDLLSSLNKQSNKSFTLCIFNDGADLSKFSLPEDHKEYPVFGTPIQIRQQMLNQLSLLHFDLVVFVDSDDYLSDSP